MKAYLTEQVVKRLEPPKTGQQIVWDDRLAGFGVRVTSGGAKAFILNYRFHDPTDAKRRSSAYRHTIGRFGPHDWTVVAARKEATKWRRLIDRGVAHPLAERRQRRDAVRTQREAETFSEAVEDYIKRYQEGEKGNATSSEVKRALLKAGAAWHDLPLTSIAATDIRALLESVRDGNEREGIPPRPYMANRLFAYLRTFFRWAAEPGIDLLVSSPMERLRKPWDGEQSRNRVLNDDELRALWSAADAIGGTSGAFVKMIILTGKRKRALAAMRWDELSPDGVWTPTSSNTRRRQTKRQHPIPLPKLARRIVGGLPKVKGNIYVFASPRRREQHLDPGSPLQRKVQEKSGVADFFWHACRHTVETRLAEMRSRPDEDGRTRPLVPPHIRDLLLDHAAARGSGAGYDHADYEHDMIQALELWAGHIEQLVAPKGVKVLR